MPAPSPQLPNARISFGTIMSAIAAQLLEDEVVNDPAQIVWGTPQNVPQFTGEFDILLIARQGVHGEEEKRDAGPGQFQVRRMVDVFYRSSAILDPGGGYQTWLTGVFEAGDRILDSVGIDGWQPEDANGNLLTVEPILLIGDSEPEYAKAGGAFGDFVVTLSCLYMPAIDPSKGVFPLP